MAGDVFMDTLHYNEMKKEYEAVKGSLDGSMKIYVFGHCEATEKLIDLLVNDGCHVCGIMDNNNQKYGLDYRNVPIISPNQFIKETGKNDSQSTVLIAARAYESMVRQLRRLGYDGSIHKMVNYNSFADYSLSDRTVQRMSEREKRGETKLMKLHRKYKGDLLILCPFSALGDITFVMSYLPFFLFNKGIADKHNTIYPMTGYRVCVIGKACGEVVKMYNRTGAEIISQNDMDEIIQAAVYTRDKNVFIAHQDRPYFVNLHRALYVKCIPLEQIYREGVFGLSNKCKPWQPYYFVPASAEIKVHSVILSPYAKSVQELPGHIWRDIIENFRSEGYTLYTNAVGDEATLPGTIRLSVPIGELPATAEKAGTFIGIRSGLCDVLRYTKCRKIALYPDYFYSDTRWKAIEMYHIPEFEEYIVDEDFQWQKK